MSLTFIPSNFTTDPLALFSSQPLCLGPTGLLTLLGTGGFSSLATINLADLGALPGKLLALGSKKLSGSSCKSFQGGRLLDFIHTVRSLEIRVTKSWVQLGKIVHNWDASSVPAPALKPSS